MFAREEKKPKLFLFLYYNILYLCKQRIETTHMMTIDTYIQQKNEEFLRLEIAYSNLYRAYMLGDIDRMRYQYDLASQIDIPFFYKKYSKSYKTRDAIK